MQFNTALYKRKIGENFLFKVAVHNYVTDRKPHDITRYELFDKTIKIIQMSRFEMRFHLSVMFRNITV